MSWMILGAESRSFRNARLKSPRDRKKGSVMHQKNHHRTHKQESPEARSNALRHILFVLREQEVQRLKELVRNEAALSDEPAPGDEVDEAQRDEDMDLNVSLIEKTEERLTAIRSAFDRLDSGDYGICETCGDEISFERLRAVPMACCCVDCQAQAEASRDTRLRTGLSLRDENGAFGHTIVSQRALLGKV
jgi:DnaK suppressor protein